MYSTHQPPPMHNTQLEMPVVEIQAPITQHFNFPTAISVEEHLSRPIVYQEYLDGWLLQWRKRKNWIIEIPQIKECKKRKEGFSSTFSQVLYKAPYKYHLYLCGNGIQNNDNVAVQIALSFENGESINKGNEHVLSNGKREIHPKKMEKKNTRENAYEATVGPFQFNVCSFRQEGRKFRMIIYFLSQSLNARSELICSLMSQPFIIRAKKPIKNPGTRSKRKRSEKKTSTKKRKVKEENINDLNFPQIKVTNSNTLTQIRNPNQLISQVNFPPPSIPNVMQQDLRSNNIIPINDNGQREVNSHGQVIYQGTMDNVFAFGQDTQKPNETEKVTSENKEKDFLNLIINEYSEMLPEKRIVLLTRLLEISYPGELSFIQSMFFLQDNQIVGNNPPIFSDMEKLLDENEDDFP